MDSTQWQKHKHIKVGRLWTWRIPYIGNHLWKKMFTDFMSLGAFANIFLCYFLLITKKFNWITKFMNVFSWTLWQSTYRESFLLQTIPDIRYTVNDSLYERKMHISREILRMHSFFSMHNTILPFNNCGTQHINRPRHLVLHFLLQYPACIWAWLQYG